MDMTWNSSGSAPESLQYLARAVELAMQPYGLNDNHSVVIWGDLGTTCRFRVDTVCTTARVLDYPIERGGFAWALFFRRDTRPLPNP
jgi:hypothetical protein